MSDKAFILFLGDRIKQARIAKGLSQAELAKSIGMSQLSVSRIESGRQATSETAIKDMAAILGIDYDALMASSNKAKTSLDNLSVEMNELKKQMEAVLKSSASHQQKEYEELLMSYGPVFFNQLHAIRQDASLVRLVVSMVGAAISHNQHPGNKT